MGVGRGLVVVAIAAAACGGSGRPAGDAGPSDGREELAVDASPDASELWPPESCGGAFPALALERVGTGTFGAGTFIGAAAGDEHRLYVGHQFGVISLLIDGELQAAHFLDLTTTTASAGESGAFAIAFHPDYATNGRFWVSRTPAADGAVTVEEFHRSAADPDRAEPAPVRVLARSAPGDGSHNGGALAFGPDGRLYLSVGDGRSGDAQDPAYLRGKIFRLDVDAPGTGPVDLGAVTWARGLRNPWRMSFDRATGDLYIGDVGGRFEEIDVERAGGAGGRDYGWPTADGDACATPGCDLTGVTVPVTFAAAGVVIGGYVYRGRAIPCLRGWYVYTDFLGGEFSRLHLSGATVVDHATIAGLDPHPMVDLPTSLGEDAAGELYVVNRNSGGLFRLVAAP